MTTPRHLIPVLCACLGFAPGASAVETPDARSLTLAAALAASAEDHPDAAVATARVMEAQARLRQANAALLPSLGVSSSYTLTDQPALAFMSLINHRAYTPAIDANNPPTVDNLNLGVNLRVPLYTPGAWSARTAAQRLTSAARYEQLALHSALAFTTVQAFIGVHQAQAHTRAAHALLTAMEANLGTARARHGNGQLSKADLLGLEAALAGARSQVAAAQGGLELAGQALATALGRSGSLTDLADMPIIAAPEAAAAGEKPELGAIRAQAAAAKAGIAQAEAQYLPRLGAFGGYGYDRGFKQDGDGTGWHAGIGVEWNLYAGGATSAGIAQAEAQRATASAAVRRAALQIEQGRAGARSRHATALAQHRAATAQTTAAEEAERLQAERFAAGAATAADLTLTEAQLAQARSALADAEAAQRLAIAELRWQYGVALLP